MAREYRGEAIRGQFSSPPTFRRLARACLRASLSRAGSEQPTTERAHLNYASRGARCGGRSETLANLFSLWADDSSWDDPRIGETLSRSPAAGEAREA
jgi:hypothetical protein